MPDGAAAAPAARFGRSLRWVAVLGAGLAVALVPVPDGISGRSWALLAIFVSTIAGLMIQPLPGGAMVLLGVSATAVSGVLSPEQALAGYGDPIVWLVLAGFLVVRGVVMEGLGRRVGFAVL